MRSMMAAMLMGAVAWPAMATAQTAPATPSTTTPAAQSDPQDGADGAGGAEEAADGEADIVVTGARPRGSVIGDIPPDQTLSPADVRSYGVSSIADLLTELTPQTTSGRGGAPVVLLNGKRISGFQEIRDLPTEAISRVEILPEEVALKYGYSADQKVVNFVLRNRFRSTVVEATGRVPTQGGQVFGEGEVDLVQIRRDKRFSLHTEYQESSALTEAERGITAPQTNFGLSGNVLGAGGRGEIDPALSALTGTATTIVGVPAGVADPTLAQFAGTPADLLDATRFRTLQGAQRQFGTNVTYAQPIFGNISASINAQVQTTQSTSLQGLPTAQLALPSGNPFSPFGTDVVVARGFDGDFSPLRQRNNALTGRLGAALNGELGRWRWTLTGAYDRSESRVATDTGLDAGDFNERLAAGDPGANPFGPLTPVDLPLAARNFARSTAQTGSVDALLNGRLFSLPAGDVSTSIKVGADTNSVDSRSFRFGELRSADISRETVNGQVNLDLPIASRTRGVLSPLRQLSLNLNAGVNEVSDFGTLTTIGYGANWSPIEGLRLIANVTDADSAPSPTQLGNPQITTPNVRVFDYVRGETATVTTIGGGNPLLRASNRHVERLGLTLKPWSQTDLNLTASFVNSRTDDPVIDLTAVTAEIAAAFPDRFLRDETGALVRLDTRPINFARTERSELRWGFNFSKPIKSQIQRQIEAYRAGQGPNPFEGLRPPGGERRRGGADGDRPRTPREGDAPARGDGDGPRAEGGPPPGGPGGGFRGPGGFGGRGPGGGQGGGRIQFALYHTVAFKDRRVLADGGPVLDLLDGGAIGNGGGSPRHQVELQAGYSNNGLGARLSGNWQSTTRVNGGTAEAPEALTFGSLATANLRLFADLGQRLDLVRERPWLRGVRVSLYVNNLFNQRQEVRDATGVVPNRYQPGYLDPLGRTVRLSVRKLFS